MYKPIKKKELSLEEKFINHLFKRGKKSVARRILAEAYKEIVKEGNANPEKVFEKALLNVQPTLEVRARRMGGSNYQIPVEVNPKRRVTLAVRWLIQAAREGKKSSMGKSLANEIINAAKKQGAAIKKKDDTHRMAEANKAFAHFAKYA